MNARFLSFILGSAVAVAACDNSVTPPEPSSGAIRVTVATTGADLDPDGYSLSVDGGTAQFVLANDAWTFAGLPAGSHTVTLGGMASNCALSGQNPRTVSVSAGATAQVSFSAACTKITGSVRVTTATTGVDLDPDGYSVSVDGGPGQFVDANGALTVSGLTLGDHTVTLAGVAGNCTVSGQSSYTVTVTPIPPAQVAFAISCTLLAGSLQVTTSTTGIDLDADGYIVTVDGGSGTVVPANGTVTLSGLSVGSRTVTLSGVAGNCTVGAPNPRTVTITSGATTATAFVMTCARAGPLAFVSERDGNREIYVMNTDGSNPVRLTTNAAADLSPAWSPDGSKIVFSSDRDGNSEIYVMNADGSSPSRLTNNTATELDPAWSPDGSKIAFASDRSGASELYVMNADGSGAVRLTSNVGFWGRPAWSPDGAKLAFNCVVVTNNDDICAVNGDGTGLVRLTNDLASDFGAAWRPDGSKIAFSTTRYGDYNIAVMNPDGSGVMSATATSGLEPAWSPNGGRIVFSGISCDPYYGCYYDGILVMNADGTGLVRLTTGSDYLPAWRP